jgi:hypothetical protein
VDERKTLHRGVGVWLVGRRKRSMGGRWWWIKEEWGIGNVWSSRSSIVGVLGEGVGVGCWKDLGKEVKREDWLLVGWFAQYPLSQDCQGVAGTCNLLAAISLDHIV